MTRSAKIVATIGPACRQPAMLRALLQAGVDVARLNFSHGVHEEHASVIRDLRAIAADLGRSICILQDLQGPKIRTGRLPEPVELVAGQVITLTTGEADRAAGEIPVDFPELVESVQVGGNILLDDGNLELTALAVKGCRVEARVVLGGLLKAHKGINLPGGKITIPGFTEKDQADLAFGLAQGIDAVAVSFVRCAEDIQQVRRAIQACAPDQASLPVIAKLERPEAIENLEEILAAADGVMVARGDLGVEMPPELVPVMQKRIIQTANRSGKVVITATQMLDSMIHNPRPTRAETSDVANAIFDGSDAVMLSGETASGEYPLKAVEMMHAIICQAEKEIEAWGRWNGRPTPVSEQDDAYFATLAARELAHDRNVAALAVFTKTGRTALLMSKARPGVAILGFTHDPIIYQRMSLYWGVKPHLTTIAATIEDMLRQVEAASQEVVKATQCQQIVLVCGYPLYQQRAANMALLHTVGERPASNV